MADRGFNSIFVVIAICMLLLQGSSGATYFDESDDRTFAIEMVVPDNGSSFTVTIFFESRSDSGKSFFTEEKIAWLEKLNSCTLITIIYSPCANAQFGADKKLTCTAKDDRCAVDRFLSCVPQTIKDETVAMGKLLLCIFSTGKTADKCAVDQGIHLDPINTCINNGTGDTKCLAFKNSFTDAKKKRSPSAGPISSYAFNVCNKMKYYFVGCVVACG